MRRLLVSLAVVFLIGCRPTLTPTPGPSVSLTPNTNVPTLTADATAEEPVATAAASASTPTARPTNGARESRPLTDPIEGTVCGETEVVEQTEFFRPYTPENTKGGLPSLEVRTVAPDLTVEGRVWLGMKTGGVVVFDKEGWRHCLDSAPVNAIALDDTGVCVGTDPPPGEPAFACWEERQWTDFSTLLPDVYTPALQVQDFRVYDIEAFGGCFYMTTWEGEAVKCGDTWTTLREIGHSATDHMHAILHARNGDIWLGCITQCGVLRHKGTDAADEWTVVAIDELGGVNVRQIAEHPTNPEEWFVFDEGQVTVHNQETDVWTLLSFPTSLETGEYIEGADHVQDLDFDSAGRAFISTNAGVFYWDNGFWNPMPDMYPTFAVAISGEDLWIATNGFGLIHTRVPAHLIPRETPTP